MTTCSATEVGGRALRDWMGFGRTQQLVNEGAGRWMDGHAELMMGCDDDGEGRVLHIVLGEDLVQLAW